MKKIFFGCLSAVFVLSMISCHTVATPPVNATTMNIANPYVGIAPLGPENYTVLGHVSGNGSVSYNSRNNEYTGDTLKYGSLGDLGSIGHVSNVTTSSGPWGLNTTTQSVVNTPSNSREMAIGNATYDLIEKAKAMGADAIIFVTTSIEATAEASTRISTSIVTMSGIAIKLK